MTRHLPEHTITSAEGFSLLQDTIGSLSEGVAIFDAQHRLVIWNERYCQIYSLIRELIVQGALWDDLVRAGVKRGLYVNAVGNEDAWLAENLDRGIAYDQEFPVTHTDGRSYLSRFHRTSSGGFIVTRREVTEQLAAEATARERERLVQKVIESNPVAIVMARLEDGKIIYRSPAADAKFGRVEYAQEFFTTPAERQKYVDLIKPTGAVDGVRLTLLDANGNQFTAAASGRITEYNGEKVVLTANTDITEQMESEALIRLVLEACPAPVQMNKVSNGEILFSSPETIALFGDVENVSESYVDMRIRAAYVQELRKEGFLKERKVQYRNAQGMPIWTAVSARMIRYKGEEVIVSFTRDLTEQLAVEQELADQKEMLFQNEKMSALGELLAGVAHELNNPLSVVVGHSLMLAEDTTDPDVLRQIGKISSAAERCTNIVKTFLSMARQQPTKMEMCDVNALIKTAVDVASYGQAFDRIAVISDLADDLPLIQADGDQITQVIISLILNAEHAMQNTGQSGNIWIETKPAKDGKSISIVVEDDGPGIPSDIRGRIFEPFFTTKGLGEGAGTGLALCHRIVMSHKGQIRLSSETGRGSRFDISLPIVNTAIQASETTVPEMSEKPAGRVLIVDDEVDVADLTAEILERTGYAVDVVYTPSDAVMLMRKGAYSVILSDLNMPDIDGRGFYDVIARDFPELLDATGFITGDTMGKSSQTFLKETQRPYLEKPVSPTELRAFVAAIQDRKEAEQ